MTNLSKRQEKSKRCIGLQSGLITVVDVDRKPYNLNGKLIIESEQNVITKSKLNQIFHNHWHWWAPVGPVVCWAAAWADCWLLSSSSSVHHECCRMEVSAWVSGLLGTPGLRGPGCQQWLWSDGRRHPDPLSAPAWSCSPCPPPPVCPEKSLLRQTHWRNSVPILYMQ